MLNTRQPHPPPIKKTEKLPPTHRTPATLRRTMYPPEDEITAQAILRSRELANQVPQTRHRDLPSPPLPMKYIFFTLTPIDNFTHIHQADPTQALDSFPAEVIQKWISEPGFKIIARIFNYDNYTYHNHDLPKAILTATLATISAIVSPESPPLSCISPPNPPSSTPSPCMLVTIPSDLVQRTLLESRIWASQWITFEALPPTTYPHPTAIFAIGSFPQNVPSDPENFLKGIWSSPQNAKRIAETLIREDELDISAKDVTEHMLHTLVLHPFPYPRT